jgi:hypothetical protein
MKFDIIPPNALTVTFLPNNPWRRIFFKTLIFSQLAKKFLVFLASSLAVSQDPALGSFAKSFEFCSHTPHSSTSHLNIMLTSIPRSPKCTLPVRFTDQYFV